MEKGPIYSHYFSKYINANEILNNNVGNIAPLKIIQENFILCL